LVDTIPNWDTRKWTAFLETCKEFPESTLADGEVAWQNKVRSWDNFKHNSQEYFEKQYLGALDVTKIVKEAKVEEGQMRKDVAAEVRLQKLLVEEKKIDLKAEQLRAQEAEAVRQREIEEAPVEAAPVVEMGPLVGATGEVLDIKDDGEVDVLRDTRWVYGNLSDLVVTDASGIKRLNVTALQRAPSKGAAALAAYALVDDGRPFIEKFVSRLLPKDVTEVLDIKEVEAVEDLDPDFSALDQYITNPEGRGEG